MAKPKNKTKSLPLADKSTVELLLTQLDKEIAELEKKRRLPLHTSISRYSVSGCHYFKLYHRQPSYERSQNYPNPEAQTNNKKTRYKHLGRPRTKAFVDAVIELETTRILEIKRQTRTYLQMAIDDIPPAARSATELT